METVCVIGGSRYFGKRLIERLRDAGVKVTVVNRGSVTPPAGVEHLTADRDDEAALTAALGDRSFDAVIDQVCYTPAQAAMAVRVFGGRTRRYVMTSTIEVYSSLDTDRPLAEEAFDARTWPVTGELPEDADERYAEGKRQAEAVFAQAPDFPSVAVRTAHVLGGGAEDFTGRLGYYVSRIRSGEPIAVHADSRPSTFIEYEEIADFLMWTAGAEFTGPVNACSHGEFGVTELCELIWETDAGGRPVYGAVDGDASPFSFERSYGMDNARATLLGYRFSHYSDWLPGVIAEVTTH